MKTKEADSLNDEGCPLVCVTGNIMVPPMKMEEYLQEEQVE